MLRFSTKLIAWISAVAIPLAIVAPWFAPGYLFGTDWTGPRFLRWPTELSASAPTEALLAAVSAVISAEIGAKLLVFAALFVAAITAYKSLPYGDFAARAAAALIYVFNPFVYGRMHYGQYLLIAAYAVLPWTAIRIHRIVVAPNLANAALLAVGLLIVGALAVHLLLVLGVLLLLASIAAVIYRRFERHHLVSLGLMLAVTAAITLVLSAYWLIPYLGGRSPESAVIAQTGPAELFVYRVVADPAVGLLPNLAGLYGFWAEGVGRFPSMKLFVPFWPVVLLVLLLLAGLGVAFVFVSKDDRIRSLRWWVVALLAAGVVALVLEAGIAQPQVAPIVNWLDAVFPPYRGMRDSGKWAAMIALVYAQLVPLGVMGTRAWLTQVLTRPAAKEWALGLTTGFALALPLYYGNGLLFGMHGGVRPSSYPTGWYQADRLIAADPHHARAVFLPWHLYLRLSFVHNQNAVIANPAPSFFSVPVLTSADPEVPGISPPLDRDQRLIDQLFVAGATADWGQALATANIKYVLLAKEVDWRTYVFLDQQSNLVRVADYGSIVVYRNLRMT